MPFSGARVSPLEVVYNGALFQGELRVITCGRSFFNLSKLANHIIKRGDRSIMTRDVK